MCSILQMSTEALDRPIARPAVAGSVLARPLLIHSRACSRLHLHEPSMLRKYQSIICIRKTPGRHHDVVASGVAQEDWGSAYHEYAVEHTADYLAFVVAVAVGEIAILLHPSFPPTGVSVGMWRGRQQNDSHADG